MKKKKKKRLFKTSGSYLFAWLYKPFFFGVTKKSVDVNVVY